MSTEHETHAVVQARRHLRDVADAYVELEERMHNGSERVGGTRPRPVGDDGETTAKMPASPSPADLQAVVVRMEISAWATWLARAVMDHVVIERYVGPPWAAPVVVEPWAPPTTDPAALLREIAERHLGTFLADPLEAGEFLEAAEQHAGRARSAAWPSGARWLPLGVDCPEAGTDDMGRRVPCGGEYRMWMRPEQDALGDMVCDRDDAHRITPAEWQRAMRRRPMDENAAARLARTLRLAGRIRA